MSRDDYDDDATVIVERRSAGVGTFLAGLAIGAGIALLLAPQTGAELRRNIKRNARRARRVAEDTAHDVRERAEDLLGSARAEIRARVDDARDVIGDRKRDVARAVQAGRTAARDARATFERRIADARRGDARPGIVPPSPEQSDD